MLLHWSKFAPPITLAEYATLGSEGKTHKSAFCALKRQLTTVVFYRLAATCARLEQLEAAVCSMKMTKTVIESFNGHVRQELLNASGSSRLKKHVKWPPPGAQNIMTVGLTDRSEIASPNGLRASDEMMAYLLGAGSG